MRTPEGTSLAATQIAAERIAREVRQWPEVRTTVTSIGDNQQKTPNLASIFVRLVPPDARTASQDELQNRVRNEIVSKLPKDYRTSVSIVAAFGAGSFSTATVQYILNGPNEKLAHYSDQIVAKLKAIPGAVDVDTTFVTGNPELVATVNRRKAADLGVNVMDVALASQLLIGGVKVSRFEEAGRDYDILVRADEGARTSPEALSQLTVASTKLGTVPLLDVDRPEEGGGAVEDRALRAPAPRDVPGQHRAGRRLGRGGHRARDGGQGDEAAGGVHLRARSGNRRRSSAPGWRSCSRSACRSSSCT